MRPLSRDQRKSKSIGEFCKSFNWKSSIAKPRFQLSRTEKRVDQLFLG